MRAQFFRHSVCANETDNMTLLQFVIFFALSTISVLSYSEFVMLNECHTNLCIPQLFA